ncbi:MAG: hypothetical protein K2K48_00710 [Anaeroplasmataceae bacterium]|nr:hypothetical protein [Anaeroplasmataceae bacterium]MDE6413914.1 hypothetical protein [Anaeroplasmataceae bacterium]
MARSVRRNKTQFVLRKELIILVLILVAMIVTTVCLSIPSAGEKRLEEFNTAITTYNSTNNTSFTTLDEDSVIRKASIKKVSSEIKSDAKGTEENPRYTYVLYGSLSDSIILQYLSAIDTEAQRREVKVVYLYSSEKVDKQEDKDDVEFLADLEKDEDVFNADVLEGVDEVDLLKTPAFYVYRNGELVFNSTTLEEDGSYNWELIINKAFSK